MSKYQLKIITDVEKVNKYIPILLFQTECHEYNNVQIKKKKTIPKLHHQKL